MKLSVITKEQLMDGVEYILFGEYHTIQIFYNYNPLNSWDTGFKIMINGKLESWKTYPAFINNVEAYTKIFELTDIIESK